MQDQLEHSGDQFNDLKNEKEKLDIKYENTCEKLRKAEDKMEKDAEEAKQRHEDLERKFRNAEVEWKK